MHIRHGNHRARIRLAAKQSRDWPHQANLAIRKAVRGADPIGCIATMRARSQVGTSLRGITDCKGTIDPWPPSCSRWFRR